VSTIGIEITGVDAVVRELSAFPEQAERAEARAARKTVKWAETQLRRAIAKEHEIPLKSIRKARRVQSKNKLVWLGYNPVKAGYAGKLEQMEVGAMAGAYYFEGGFVATLRSGHASIFKRRGRARLPIDEQKVALVKAEAIAEREAERIESRFFETLRRELNYEINVRGSP
jgi:hypothetical protein